MRTLSRDEAIALIRTRLMRMTDEDHSMCRVAAEQGIFCSGFARLSDEQLRQRYSWLLRNHPDLNRQQLEDSANRWELARQVVNCTPLSCDAQHIEKDTCQGWDGFDDAALARFYMELTGEEVVVAGNCPTTVCPR